MKGLFNKLGLVIVLGLLSVFFGNIKAQTLSDAIKLTQSERYEDAETAYKAVLSKEPSNSDAYFFYGENILLSHLADPYSISVADASSQASGLFNKGLKADSTNALNNIGLGMVVLLQTSDTTKANVYFAKAISQFPKKKKKYTTHHILYLMKLGEAQMYAKSPNYTKAVSFLNTAIEVAPNDPEVYLSLGSIYDKSMDASKAIANYNKTVYLDAKNVMALVKIGNIYMRSRNLNEARNFLDKAKQIDSTYAPVYKYFGEMYNMAGVYGLSKSNYKKYLDLSGNNMPARISYVNSLYKSRDYNEAYNNLQEILQVEKSRNYLYRLAAYCAYEKKPADNQAALGYIETFFKNTTPDKIITKDYAYYGRILLKLKKDSAMIDNGFKQLTTAFNLDTTDYTLLSDITLNAYYLKRFDVAATMLNRKIASGNADINDYMYLGKTYYQTKQYGKADTIFNQAVKIDPTYMQAYVWIANTAASQDPDSKLGLAKPKYETVIEKASIDKVKYSKELIDSYSYLGSYYLFMEKPDYEKAEEAFTKLTEVDPQNKSAIIRGYTSIALIAMKQKQYAKARVTYGKILEVDPKNDMAIKQLEALKKVK
jgi:tetratricopeptide (TPR) repeat protein